MIADKTLRRDGGRGESDWGPSPRNKTQTGLPACLIKERKKKSLEEKEHHVKESEFQLQGEECFTKRAHQQRHFAHTHTHAHTLYGGFLTLWCKHIPHLLTPCSSSACRPHLGLLISPLPPTPHLSPQQSPAPRPNFKNVSRRSAVPPLVDGELSMATGGRKFWPSVPVFPLPSMLSLVLNTAGNKDANTHAQTCKIHSLRGRGGRDETQHWPSLDYSTWLSSLVETSIPESVQFSHRAKKKNICVTNRLSSSANSSSAATSCKSVPHTHTQIHTLIRWNTVD